MPKSNLQLKDRFIYPKRVNSPPIRQFLSFSVFGYMTFIWPWLENLKVQKVYFTGTFHFVLGLLVRDFRFSYDLERKTREQNRNNKRTEIEPFDWFSDPNTNARGFWLVKRTLGWKNLVPEELSRNQSILCFDVIHRNF